MSFALRDYQADDIPKIRRALKVHKRVLYTCATGGGKTVVGGTMLHGVEQAQKRALFVCHREELVEQTAITLERADVDHGFCASGYPKKYEQPVTLCMVQTLGSRLAYLPPPNLIIFDEAHHLAAGTWKKISEAWPQAYQVGLTATPERLDGKGLDGSFNALVPGPSTNWLIKQGWLSPYRLFSHPAPDLANLKRRGSDIDPDAQAEKMSGKIIGDAVEHYQRLCPGKPAVVFCCNVAHAMETRDAFRAAGIRCEELDGNADKRVRRETVAAFRRGEIDVLTSVDLFGEGFDLPRLACVILLRFSMSLAMVLQWVGRALRPEFALGYDLNTVDGRHSAIAAGPKPYAYILDHAGNFGPNGEHGMPDDERDWKLAGRKPLPKPPAFWRSARSSKPAGKSRTPT